MCCVNFTQVASETWPSYIFLSCRHRQMSFFLFCDAKYAFFGPGSFCVEFACSPSASALFFSRFSARESKLATLNWPKVPVRMVVCLSLWPWDKLATCPGCDHAFARWQLRWAPAALVTPRVQEKVAVETQNETKIRRSHIICVSWVSYFHCSWAKVSPLCFNGGNTQRPISRNTMLQWNVFL